MEQFLNGIAAVAPIVALVVFLATVNEKLVEHVMKPITKRIGLGDLTVYVALVTGALMSLGFGMDVFTPLAEAVGTEPVVWWTGRAITAGLVGAGSILVHEVWPTGNGVSSAYDDNRGVR